MQAATGTGFRIRVRQPYVTSPNMRLSSSCAFLRASRRMRNQFVTWAKWSASLPCVAWRSSSALIQARSNEHRAATA